MNEKQFKIITNKEAVAIIADVERAGEDKYQVFKVWPLMMEVVERVAENNNGLPYHQQCDDDPAVAAYEKTAGRDYLWYAASSKYHADEQNKKDEVMVARGFIPITQDNYQELDNLSAGQVVLLAWLSLNDGEPKKTRVVKDREVKTFLVAPRARRRGWYPINLAYGDNRAYYQVSV